VITIAAIVFWACLILAFWSYAGYFLGLRFLALFSSRTVTEADELPSVSVITTLYNEARTIQEKLENCRVLDYPQDLIEFIFVSDGSTDGTEQFIQDHLQPNMRLIHFDERQGKDNAQGAGVEASSADIIVFTDATTYLDRDALRAVVSGFADESVGCISGKDITVTDDGDSGEGAYVRYEMALRELESRLGSTVVVSGCFFAVRRIICDAWHAGLTSDFYLPIHARQKGYRVIQESSAIARYRVLAEIEGEFQRKVRTVVNGLDVLFTYRKILNPFRYGSFALKMIQHKLLRWLTPFFMIGALLLNVVLLSSGSIYPLLFLAQLALYAVVLAAWFSQDLQRITLFRIPLYLVVANLAILVAWARIAAGKSQTIWEPTAR
jgi:cellulose synthase/poly-beta-1,6-N-acetylglucosamine synthase-like glycosyltransferase